LKLQIYCEHPSNQMMADSYAWNQAAHIKKYVQHERRQVSPLTRRS